MAKKSKPISTSSDVEEKTEFDKVQDALKQKIEQLTVLFDDTKCLPVFLNEVSIGHSLVDDIYDELRKIGKQKKLLIIIESGGGDLDAAYNIGLLLRSYATDNLTFIIPRWAKSAATLLVCAGDNIYMTPVAELGPLDPQITQYNPIEKRLEHFSPLDIEATLELIRSEFKDGNDKLAQGLLERLQYPLTLGGFKKSLENAKQYLEKLLGTRMFKDIKDENVRLEKIKHVAENLVNNYSHHGFCINSDEANSIGLKTEYLDGDKLDIVWDIYNLNKELDEIKRNRDRKKLQTVSPEFSSSNISKEQNIEN